MEQWNTVISFDESRFPDSSQVRVFGFCGQEFDVKMLQLTMKRGSYSMMVWRAIYNNGWPQLVDCEGKINSNKYVPMLQKATFRTFTEMKL